MLIALANELQLMVQVLALQHVQQIGLVDHNIVFTLCVFVFVFVFVCVCVCVCVCV